MLHGKYSDYSLKQIISDTESYEYISEKLLQKSDDASIIEKMKRYFVSGRI